MLNHPFFLLNACSLISFFCFYISHFLLFFQAGRNRATPARLFKLYKEMSDAQRKLVSDVGFGSLLQIGSGRLPVGLSKWLVKILDTDKEELVIPGRGKIKANAASVNRILGLPMGEDEVEYEFNGSAINFINEKCRFEDGRAPTIKSITERIAASKEANDDYLRCWLMVAISTFLCGSTALSISPKCYPSLVDLSKVKELNWCQFVVDTFKVSVGKMGKQDSVLGCHYFLAVSPFLFFCNLPFMYCIFYMLFSCLCSTEIYAF